NEENTCTYARSISTRLYRVFNNTLEDGGRFYGAQYQRIEKGLRKYLLIDGQETIELDYSGFHTRMLYHERGYDYKDDPYVGMFPSFSNDIHLRIIIKFTLNCMLNAKSRIEISYAIKKFLKQKQLED